MCNAKPPFGSGRRCLQHHSASNAEVRYTWAKTNVDRNNIYAILRELNKEGKKLDAPELAEVKAFLDKEKFKVSLDPDLSERDRKLILKNLEKAEQEVEENPISGGNFHAWKNLFNETVERMRKPFLALGLVGALTLTGCTGGLVNEPAPTGSTPAVAACSTENPGPWGDSVALREVTDELGTYCQTTLDPSSTALVYSPENVDLASLQEHGFTEQDVKDLMPKAAQFFSQEVIDSTVLDRPSAQAFEAWLSGDRGGITLDPAFSITPDSSFVFREVLPTLVRDGSSRILTSKIEFNGAKAISDANGNPAIIIYYRATVDYRVDDVRGLDFTAANNSEGLSKDELVRDFPHFSDGEENFIRLDVEYGTGYNKKGEVIGTIYEYNTSDSAFPLQK